MIKFNIAMLMCGIQSKLESMCQVEGFKLDFDLTILPISTMTFNNSMMSDYIRFITMTFKVSILDTSSGKDYVYYLFVRNGKASDHSYTRLSSIEVAQIDKQSSQLPTFVTLFKQHFVDNASKNYTGMIHSLEFNTFDEMRVAVKRVRDLVCYLFQTEFNKIKNN